MLLFITVLFHFIHEHTNFLWNFSPENYAPTVMKTFPKSASKLEIKELSKENWFCISSARIYEQNFSLVFQTFLTHIESIVGLRYVLEGFYKLSNNWWLWLSFSNVCSLVNFVDEWIFIMLALSGIWTNRMVKILSKNLNC